MKKFTPFLIAFYFLVQSGSLFADNIPTVAATGSDVVSIADTYETVVTTSGLSVTAGDKVMLIASFTCQSTQSGVVKRDITYRITDGTNNSNEIVRVLQGESGGDKGIGTLVYIFTVSTTETKTYSLQHKISNAKNSQTDATIVAMKLTTSGDYSLNNDFKAITTGVTTTSASYVAVTGTDGMVDLPVTGGLYIAASVNCYKTSGTGDNAGEWTLQYKQGASGSWTNTGNAVQRTMNSNDDEGIVSLVALLENKPKGTYYFRLAHRVSSGIAFDLVTSNTSVAGLALSYIHSTLGGRDFETFLDEPSDQTNATTSWETESTNTFTAAGAQAFLHTQFGLTASAASNAPAFQYSSSASITDNIQLRAISGTEDSGAGGMVGLMTGMTASSSYTANFQSQSTSSVTLTIKDIIFAGFQLSDGPAQGYWNGSVSRAWETANNWTDLTVPTSSTNVYIPDVANDPIISGTTLRECTTLEIASGATLDIEDDGSLTVSGALTNNGTITIESTASGTGSLIFGSGTPSATVQRYFTDNMWHIVTPVTTGVTVLDFHWFDTPQSWLLTHDESDNSWTYITALSTALNVGQGYMVWLDDNTKSDATTTMTGNLQSADLAPSLAYTDAAHGLNLIGNPFTCAIDYDLGTWGSNTSGFVYVWDNAFNSGDYRVSGTSLTDNIIPEGQGFFVDATSAGAFTIPAAARVHSTQAFYKSGNNTAGADKHVRIQLDGNGYGNTLYVGFPDIGTDGTDYKGDARKIYSATDVPQLFAVENNIELCVNANKPLIEGESKTVPLHLVQIVDGEYSLSISDLDQLEYNSIRLEDVKTGITQDFIKFPSYTFTASSNDNPERFLLHFAWSPDGLGEDHEQNSNIQIFSSGSEVCIRSTEEAINQKGMVIIYDLMGRELLRQSIEKSELVRIPLNISNNYIVVKVVKDRLLKTEIVFFK